MEKISKGVLLVLFSIVLSVSLVSAFSIIPSRNPHVYVCKDSDGFSPGVLGTTTVYKLQTKINKPQQTISKTDYCIGNTVMEWYCSNNSISKKPNILSAKYDCTKDGKVCRGGRCVAVKPDVTCQTFGFAYGKLGDKCDGNYTNSTTYDLSMCYNEKPYCNDPQENLNISRLLVFGTTTFGVSKTYGPSCLGSGSGGASLLRLGDKCADSNTVMEAVCRENLGTYKNFTCPSGTVCDAGYCKSFDCSEGKILKITAVEKDAQGLIKVSYLSSGIQNISVGLAKDTWINAVQVCEVIAGDCSAGSNSTYASCSVSTNCVYPLDNSSLYTIIAEDSSCTKVSSTFRLPPPQDSCFSHYLKILNVENQEGNVVVTVKKNIPSLEISYTEDYWNMSQYCPVTAETCDIDNETLINTCKLTTLCSYSRINSFTIKAVEKGECTDVNDKFYVKVIPIDITPPQLNVSFYQISNNLSNLFIFAQEESDANAGYIGIWYQGPTHPYWYGFNEMYYNCSSMYCAKSFDIYPMDGPGNYSFWVRAYNKDNVWSEKFTKTIFMY